MKGIEVCKTREEIEQILRNRVPQGCPAIPLDYKPPKRGDTGTPGMIEYVECAVDGVHVVCTGIVKSDADQIFKSSGTFDSRAFLSWWAQKYIASSPIGALSMFATGVYAPMLGSALWPEDARWRELASLAGRKQEGDREAEKLLAQIAAEAVSQSDKTALKWLAEMVDPDWKWTAKGQAWKVSSAIFHLHFERRDERGWHALTTKADVREATQIGPARLSEHLKALKFDWLPEKTPWSPNPIPTAPQE